MTKSRRTVHWLFFDRDGTVLGRHSAQQMVYEKADGTLEANRLGRRQIFRAPSGALFGFNGQRMPCLVSARPMLEQIARRGHPMLP